MEHELAGCFLHFSGLGIASLELSAFSLGFSHLIVLVILLHGWAMEGGSNGGGGIWDSDSELGVDAISEPIDWSIGMVRVLFGGSWISRFSLVGLGVSLSWTLHRRLVSGNLLRFFGFLVYLFSCRIASTLFLF